MTGHPRRNDYQAATVTPCTGDWACSLQTDGRHCVCVMDAPAAVSVACCQCGPMTPNTPLGRFAQGLRSAQALAGEEAITVAECTGDDPSLQDYWPDDVEHYPDCDLDGCADTWTHDYVVSDDDDTDEWREQGLDPNDADPADRYPEVSR